MPKLYNNLKRFHLNGIPLHIKLQLFLVFWIVLNNRYGIDKMISLG